MRYLIFFVILINAKFCVSEECSINSEDGSLILDLTNERTPKNIGTFSKNKNEGDVLIIFNVVGVTPTILEPSGNCKAEYFDKPFNENKLIFSIAKAFENFDTDSINNAIDNPFECKFYLHFDASESCSNTDPQITRTYLQFTINDYNLHEPEFIDTPSELQVDYPLAKGVSLTTLAGKQIAAKDIDFSTKAITFEFTEDSEYFELKPGSPSSHNFPVDIIAKKVLNLQQPVTLTLKATDDGQDPEAKSATTTITIQPGENSTPPNPEFEEPYYQGEIDLEVAQENDVIGNGIKLNENYEKVNVNCEGNGYFKCEKDSNNVDVIITLLKKPEEDLWSNGPVIVLSLKAEIENSIKPGIAPFVITLKNIPLSTTTTESFTETTAGTTEGSEGTTGGSEGTTGGSEGTTGGSEGTTGGSEGTTGGSEGTTGGSEGTTETPDDSTGTDDNTDGTTPPPYLPCNPSDDDENADLLVTIIVLSIIVGVLLIAVAVMYFKYVKGRKNDQKAHLLDSDSDNIETIGPAEMRLEERRKESVESETFSKPLDALPENDEIEIQNEIDRKPKGLDSLIAEKEENNLLKPDEVKSRKRSMTFSESDDESRQYRENLSKPVMTEVINENKPSPVRKKSVVTFKL